MLKNNKIIGIVLFIVLLISCCFYFHEEKEVTQNSPTNNINKKEIKENNKVNPIPIKKREIILLNFIGLNKHLYFDGMKLNEIKVLKGNKKKLVDEKNYVDENVQSINLNGEYILKYKKINIFVNSDNVYINNISMKNAVNAIIEENEDVTIGGFISRSDLKQMTPEDEIMIKKMREQIKQNILRTNDPVQIIL